MTTEYYLDGTRLVEQTDETNTLHFNYDRTGEVIGFTHYYLSTGVDDPTMAEYMYVKNAQGDIVGITDPSGKMKVSYTYDPWVRLISVESDLDQYERDIATLNPLRYRGYYYDTDTGLYYLQSRYYDPETGRFINADNVNYIGVSGTKVGYNPFAYCENDPINGLDPFGTITYAYIPKSKANNWSYIINKAVSIYKSSGIYEQTYITFYNKRMQPTSKLPVYMLGNTATYIDKMLTLNYISNLIQYRNTMYLVSFGYMTVAEWQAYIIGKHESLYSKYKKSIKKKISKLNLDEDQIDDIIEAAIELADYILLYFGIYPIGVEMGTIPETLQTIKDGAECIDVIYSYLETKIRDKEDKYIENIIKDKISSQNYLIILKRENYVYGSRYYLRGGRAICETGWHLQKIEEMY